MSQELMLELGVLLLAICIVLVGILAFRLHAFLALLLAALTVSLLTPRASLEKYAQQQVAADKLSVKQAEEFATAPAAKRVAASFGTTCKDIGIVIAMAAIIGKCLLDSGAADRIVRSTVKLVGVARAPVAFVGSSFLLGIPVFFDTVFYLMIPLGKALRLRTGQHYVLYILSIVAGGSMAHSLVPPTPGPLYVADNLGVNLLVMIVAGCAVGCCSATAAFLFASWLDRRMEIPLRSSAEMPLEDLEALAQRDDSQLPSLWVSILPILLPVALIAAQTTLDRMVKTNPSPEPWLVNLRDVGDMVGNKTMALVLAGLVALATLAWQKRGSGQRWQDGISQAIAGGGVIILITCAGGAFGRSVRETGIGDQIGQYAQVLHPHLMLLLAFLLTTLIRTAQGSATVAMITAVGVMQPLIDKMDLPFSTVYVALAIGCGSKPIAWMADSGFWVICKMSGMTEAEGLKTITPTSIVMGVAGLAATLLGAWFLPLK